MYSLKRAMCSFKRAMYSLKRAVQGSNADNISSRPAASSQCWQNSHTFTQKSPIFTQKSHLFTPKSHVFTLKSPAEKQYRQHQESRYGFFAVYSKVFNAKKPQHIFAVRIHSKRTFFTYTPKDTVIPARHSLHVVKETYKRDLSLCDVYILYTRNTLSSCILSRDTFWCVYTSSWKCVNIT